MALLDPHRYLYKEISCTPRLTLIKENHNQGNPYKERIPPITCIYEDLPYKEKPSPPRNECQLYFIIRTPKLSQTKVRIISPRSNTLELWTFPNLTFRGYLVGTTLELSVRFSSSLLRRSCLEHVRTVQLTDDFRHHQPEYEIPKVFFQSFLNQLGEVQILDICNSYLTYLAWPSV